MNIGNCDNANKKTVFEIADGEEVKCPCCKLTMLVEVKKKSMGLYVGIAAAVVVLGGGGAFLALSGSGGGDEHPIENVQLNKTTSNLIVGSKDTLTVMKQPAEANATYIWSSDDESIAKVDGGIVSSLKEGMATITVKVKENESVSAACVYTVEKDTGDDPIVDTPQDKEEQGDKTTGGKTDGGVDLGYATYLGSTYAGKPDGKGALTIKKSYSIDLKNGETLDVLPGDKIYDAYFEEGQLVRGELHRKSGERKVFHIGK